MVLSHIFLNEFNNMLQASRSQSVPLRLPAHVDCRLDGGFPGRDVWRSMRKPHADAQEEARDVEEGAAQVLR